MAQTKKQSAPAAPPLSDEQLSACVRSALDDRALSKAELIRKVGLRKADAARAPDVARELARTGVVHRFAKGATEIFFRDDPIATLDRVVPELLRARGPLPTTALKQAVKSAAPGHDGLLGEWLKPALARGAIFEIAKPRKALSAEPPPPPDLRPLLEKPLGALRKQIAAAVAKGVSTSTIAEFLCRELGLDSAPRVAAVAEAPASRAASREVFLEALRRFAADNPQGALLPVRELRARAGLGKQDFDATALALSREGVLVLHHHDHASALTEAEQQALVRDALGRHYVGVAFRGSA